MRFFKYTTAPVSFLLCTLCYALPFYQDLTIHNFTRNAFTIYQEADSHTGSGATPGKNQETLVPAFASITAPSEQVAHWGGTTTRHTAAMCLDTVGQSTNGGYILGNIYINSLVYAAANNANDSHFDSTNIYASNGPPASGGIQHEACYMDPNHSGFSGITLFKTLGPLASLNPLGKPFTQSTNSQIGLTRPKHYFNQTAYNIPHSAASNFEALGFASKDNTSNPTTSVAEVYYANLNGKHYENDPHMATQLYLLCINPNGKAQIDQMCPAVKLPKID